MKRKDRTGKWTVILSVAFLLIAGAFLTWQRSAGITGYAVSVPDFCNNNMYSCIDLDGDGFISVEDEDIFAQILIGNYTRYNYPVQYDMSDFDDDGDVDQMDFQQCFVPIRDYYKDSKDSQVPCNRPVDDLTNRTDHPNCTYGCADLNGDGNVDSTDFAILTGSPVFGKRTNETMYPMADLTGDGVIDIGDRFCFTPYLGKIVMCNLPTNAYHTLKCPDLTDSFDSACGHQHPAG